MVNLTFGEQVKIILSRKGMTIKQLAEEVEKHTGKPMSRQNMTQRLGRDNFQEQDMRLIAEILGCQFTLSIMEPAGVATEEVKSAQMTTEEPYKLTRDITVGELAEMTEEVEEQTGVTLEAMPIGDETTVEVQNVTDEEIASPSVEEATENESVSAEAAEKEMLRKGVAGFFKKSAPTAEKVEVKDASGNQVLGEINPYTRKEYETNSVRVHPKKIGYIQVYDRETHQWTDMTEWAFLGYQERLKKLLGKDYKPPIYLD